MKQSELFVKTLKNISSEETSRNAQLLLRGGFVYKNSAGVYSFLPLGLRVIQKISTIIREEMNRIGSIEVLMPALVENKYLEKTGRVDIDVGFNVTSKGNDKGVYTLGWTHEEVITEIATRYLQSFRDVPISTYQIQTKFRNELRAKSGLLRGREFIMKDMYSFHKDERDLLEYYEKAKEAYMRVFERVGLKAYYTLAEGGDFTMSNTHEFQVLSDAGEDTIYYRDDSDLAFNEEVKEETKDIDFETYQKGSAIEVGNIFPLGTKYSDSYDLRWQDEKGKKHPVFMGSYGIGVSRLMATVVEVHNDENGIIWNRAVAPFLAHIVPVTEDKAVIDEARKLYDDLEGKGVEVLLDVREGVRTGEKFAESDLMGIPYRIVISQSTMEKHMYEVKERDAQESKRVEKGGLEKIVTDT